MIFVYAKNKYDDRQGIDPLPSYIYFVQKIDGDLPYKYAIDEDDNYYLDYLDNHPTLLAMDILNEQLKDYFDIFEIIEGMTGYYI